MLRYRKKLRFDFTWATIDPRVGEKAAKAVAINAKGSQEALFFLDMLGLVAPQEGNEPVDGSEVKKEDDLARAKAKRDLTRLRRKVRAKNELSIKNEQLLARGIQPEEYGE